MNAHPSQLELDQANVRLDQSQSETIVAVATPPGRGGIGVIRLSGPAAIGIGAALCRERLVPRRAQYRQFFDADGETIDDGIALFFPAPASYTGEDVVELQGHGNSLIQDALIAACVAAGARPARPGEFTERAFLNGRLDLAQAEAVADLIDANTTSAARSALRSLQGEFSREIDALVSALIELRVYVESALDFPDEDIDFLAETPVQAKMQAVSERAFNVRARADRLQTFSF